MNQINIIGRLVEEPKTNQTQDGTVIVSGRIAVPRTYSKEGQEPITDFFSFSAFRSTAEIISKYCQKGKRVALSGTLQNHTWQDQQGQNHVKTIIMVNSVTLIDRKDETTNQPTNQYNRPTQSSQFQTPQQTQFQTPQQTQFQTPQSTYTQPNFSKPQQNYINDDGLPWMN